MSCDSQPSQSTAQFAVTLAEKPRDLLVFLVDHGPASPQAIAKALDVKVSLYAGGLNLLREIGLATRDPSGSNHWHATEDGRLLVARARRGTL